MYAPLMEIFSSIQGEGLLTGCRQIFLRFAGCNLSCAYCDTPDDPSPPYCRWERTPGERDFLFLPNPLAPFQVASLARELNPWIHHSFSLTGGEPLLHSEFLAELIPLLGGTRNGIFLETNGTLPGELKKIVHLVDIVAMDIKLPGVSKMPPFWQEHAEFLSVARQKKTFVKIVVDQDATDEEIDQAVQLVKKAGEVPVVIQPVTPKSWENGISPKRIMAIQEKALSYLADVRVIPQTHKIFDLL